MPSGVISIEINSKKMDTGRFLYNSNLENKDTLNLNLKNKLHEYFKWLSSFKNKEPIEKIKIYSGDYKCRNKCSIPVTSKLSVVGKLYNSGEVVKILDELCQKYQFELKITPDQLD